MRHLGVVAGPEGPAAARAFAGRAEIPIERRRENLPADVHFAGLRIHFDAADHAVEFLLVILRISDAAFRQRHRETRGTQNVFRVLRDEGGAVVAARVRNGPENLVRFEIAQINPRDAVVRVVVHEEPAPVVLRRRLRQSPDGARRPRCNRPSFSSIPHRSRNRSPDKARKREWW